MRIVGQYKGQDICLDSLYMQDTYAGHLLGTNQGQEEINLKIVNKRVKIRAERIFGSNCPCCIANQTELDYKQRLPAETWHAWLTCSLPIGYKSEYDGSHLILIWFQNTDQDPFTLAEEHLKQIDWEKYAKDFAL